MIMISLNQSNLKGYVFCGPSPSLGHNILETNFKLNKNISMCMLV